MASPKDQGVSNTAQDPVKKEEELKKKGEIVCLSF